MKIILSLLSLSFLFIFGPIGIQTAQAGEGHDAGYEWAQEHDIRDVDYDDGNSESFNEGVREYAEEMAEEEESEEY